MRVAMATRVAAGTRRTISGAPGSAETTPAPSRTGSRARSKQDVPMKTLLQKRVAGRRPA